MTPEAKRVRRRYQLPRVIAWTILIVTLVGFIAIWTSGAFVDRSECPSPCDAQESSQWGG